VSEVKKKKKVNQLTIKECEAILQRLAGQVECKYYQHILEHYRRLLPPHSAAFELVKIPNDGCATLP
jgi:hypothetical protein